MTEVFSHGYALLIGIGESAYTELSLPVTVKDTQSVYAALIDPELCAYPDNPNHIRILNNEKATRNEIISGLNWLAERAKADSSATILVYYSGHGWLEESKNRYYLLQHDINQWDISSSAISSDEFSDALHKIQAQRLLVILDCCHAAGMATSKNREEEKPFKLPSGFLSSVSKDFVNSLKQGKGRAVFTSSREEQQSWVKDENGSIYTFHLLEALKGAGNVRGDTEVRVSNLMNYLGKVVPETAKRLCDTEQNPWFDMGTEDFAVSKLNGGKGLPKEGWEASSSDMNQQSVKATTTVNAKYFTIMERAEGVHIGDVFNKT